MAPYHRLLHNLPPELLGRIFQLHTIATREPWLSADDSSILPVCLVGSGPYEWIRVTHVCRYWRDVTLQSPLLWSHITLTKNAELIKELLIRSQQAPLTVVQPRIRGGCFIERVVPMVPVRLVLAEMHRIRSLELYMKWWIFDDMAELICRPAPALKCLKLSTPHGLYDNGIRKPIILFSHDDIISLEQLTLGAYGFPWNDPAPFKALKSLQIERGITEKPTIEQVVYAFQFMPELQILSLDDVFAPSAKCLPSLPPISDTAELRYLESLALSGDVVACSTLLSALIFPGTAQVSLDFHRKGRNDDLRLAMPVIQAKLQGSFPDALTSHILHTPSPLTQIRLESSTFTYHLICWTQNPTEVEAEMGNSRRAAISICVATEPGTLDVLLRSLPMQNVKVLELAGRTEWQELASYARNLTKLRLTDWKAKEVKRLLLEDSDVGPHVSGQHEAAGRNLAFPSLRLLEVGSMRPELSALGTQMDGMKVVCDAVALRNEHPSVTRMQKARFEI